MEKQGLELLMGGQARPSGVSLATPCPLPVPSFTFSSGGPLWNSSVRHWKKTGVQIQTPTLPVVLVIQPPEPG